VEEKDQYELGSIKEYAVLCFVRIFGDEYFESGEREKGSKSHIPTGFVFVIDPKFGDSAQHKLPGGHGQITDASALAAAMRELLGETGVAVSEKHTHYVGKWPGRRGDHWKMLFTCDISEKDVAWMNSNERENEGEKPERLDLDGFYTLIRNYKFLQEHYQKLVEFGLVFASPGKLLVSAMGPADFSLQNRSQRSSVGRASHS